LSPWRVVGLLRDMVSDVVSRQFSKLRRKTGLYLVRGIEKTMGSDRAHQVFWRLWPSARGWTNTENRLGLLAQENPGAIPKFVQIALARNTDPVVLMGFARNPHSRGVLAYLLRDMAMTEDNPVTDLIRNRQQYAATFVAVAQLLLDDAAADRLVGQAMALPRAIGDAFVQIVCSAGMRTVAAQGGLHLQGARDSGFRQPVAHRLVIVDDYKDAEAVAHLFVGARQVTVLALTDLLGRADFSRFVGLGGVESIAVEHLRTRVSRFSSSYVANHEITRDAGQTIAAALADQPGLLASDQVSYVAVAIADFLHFQCLKIAAVAALLDDQGFDHIVIGTAKHVPTSEYFRLLSGVPAIATDARVELVSIARTMTPKMQFAACLATLTQRQKLREDRVSLPTDMAIVRAQIQVQAAAMADLMPSAGEGTTPQIYICTANNPAYNPSTAQYAAALAQTNRVAIIHSGLRAVPLQNALDALGDAANNIDITPLPAQFADQVERAKRALVDLLWQVQTALPDNAAAHILKINAERVVNEVMIPQLVMLQGAALWFARMQQAASLPDLVILAPARAPQLAAMAPLARRYGVPSLTLEAHGLNANYSRYLKVTTDFYGVVSGYFRKDAVNGFAIPEDRIAVVGTPRLVAPADYDPQQAQAAARTGLTEEQAVPFGERRGTISFFCQPSAWSHVALVWQSVLQAAKVLNLDILLKPHPEETPTRQAAYLALAKRMGVAGQVHLVTGPPAPVIAASDVVLTGYSAAALDAAVLQVPVICVTEGAVEYPVDQHAMIDAPLVRSTAELQAALGAILSDPAAARVHAMQFLAREHQFVEGPDNRLRAFVAEILAKPAAERIRPADTVAQSVFLDSPHPIFPV
jgi:hypothetical protein